MRRESNIKEVCELLGCTREKSMELIDLYITPENAVAFYLDEEERASKTAAPTPAPPTDPTLPSKPTMPPIASDSKPAMTAMSAMSAMPATSAMPAMPAIPKIAPAPQAPSLSKMEIISSVENRIADRPMISDFTELQFNSPHKSPKKKGRKKSEPDHKLEAEEEVVEKPKKPIMQMEEEKKKIAIHEPEKMDAEIIPAKPKKVEIEDDKMAAQIAPSPKDKKPECPKVLPKSYTKHDSPISKVTNWIEVPIKEAYEFCQYEIKYENIKPDDYVCPICRMEYYDEMFNLKAEEIERLNEEMLKNTQLITVVKFEKCSNHFYHKACAEHLGSGGDTSLKCAVCSYIYGILTGDTPEGTYIVQTYKKGQLTCSGYEGYGTIAIQYNVPDGIRKGVQYHGI